jgi:dienelactone hydrolase
LFIGKEKMIRPIHEDSIVTDDANKWVDNLYEGQYLGDYLAQNGYVVFSIDAPLWGERGRKEGVDRSRYDIIAGNMMMLGRNLCAQMHYDDIRSTEFLSSLPYVDKKRIGCAGCSMGAYRSWMLSALSDDVKVGCSVCWMITTEDQLTLKYGRKENGGFANCIPGLRNYLDYPDIASLACPKPMLFISGTKDKLFPIPGVEKAYKQMHDVWDELKAGQKLVTHIIDQPHECNLSNQAAILSFFNQHLK